MKTICSGKVYPNFAVTLSERNFCWNFTSVCYKTRNNPNNPLQHDRELLDFQPFCN